MIVMNIFGIVGYIMKKLEYEGGPFILAFILGPMFENSLRQSLMMSHGDFMIFLTRPITLGLVVTAFIILLSPLVLRKRLELGADAE
jgi:putative tricarboxylic transport membrane protein